MEKKRILILAAAACLALPASAQDLVYALPNTVITLKVEARQSTFYAGPYAAFAKKYLNLTVQDEDNVTTEVTSLELIPGVEADLSALYTCDAGNATLLALTSEGLVSLPGTPAQQAATPWRFPITTVKDYSGSGATEPVRTFVTTTYKTETAEDGTTVEIPVEHKMKKTKTLEEKAAEAAQMILDVRRDRLNIVNGNTDASYTGEAMNAALRELDRIEKEYLTLFSGYTVTNTFSGSFDVVPQAEQHVQRYLAFRLGEQGLSKEDPRGIPYFVELEEASIFNLPAPVEGKNKSKSIPVKYRIPALCVVRVTRDGTPLMETRFPVYQLGKETTMNLNN